tara:strand:- start:302 stop:766 length:465 start_codon:yes stop_codon:yes gene_type:complete
MIDLFIPLMLLNLTTIIYLLIIYYNDKIYYSYYKYPIDKLIKLQPFKIKRLYNINKIEFINMIDRLSENDKKIFSTSSIENNKLFLEVNKNYDLLPENTRVKVLNFNQSNKTLSGVITYNGPDVKYAKNIVGHVKTDYDNNIILNVKKNNIELI